MIIIFYFYDLIERKCDILEIDGFGYIFIELIEVVYLQYYFKINVIFVFFLIDYFKFIYINFELLKYVVYEKLLKGKIYDLNKNF